MIQTLPDPRDPISSPCPSDDERIGVDPITETKRFWYLGSMKPFGQFR